MKIVVAGAGGVGTYLTERLVQENHDLVVIDHNPVVLEALASTYDIQTVRGTTSAIATLKDAGLERSDIFIAATSSDEANIISCLLADSMKPDLRIIARVRGLVTDNRGLSQRIREVFDEFINPDQEVVNAMVRLIEVPGATEVNDFIDGRVRVVGTVITPDMQIANTPLKNIPHESDGVNLFVAAVATDNHLTIPSGETVLAPGDTVYLVTEPQTSSKVLEMIGANAAPVKTVFIWGGTNSGRELARRLAEIDIRVKLIDPHCEACEMLAAELNDVIVLNGRGTDQELLLEEGVEDAGYFIGATEDEEENVLAALLAKKLGCPRSAVMINNMSYMGLVKKIGVDVALNHRVMAASSILKFVRKGTVSSVFSIHDDDAEVIETTAKEGSKIVGRALMEIKFPQGALVAAVVKRGTVTIPRGNTIIEPGDRLVLITDRSVLPKIEKLLESPRR